MSEGLGIALRRRIADLGRVGADLVPGRFRIEFCDQLGRKGGVAIDRLNRCCWQRAFVVPVGELKV